MASLERAVALAEVHDGAVAVGKQLDLDVLRALDVVLEEDRVVAEARLRLPPRGLERFLELLGPLNDTHSAAASACGRLDHERIADLLGGAGGHDRYPRRLRRPLGGQLVSRGPENVGRWPDPRQLSLRDCLCQLGVLRQEAVAGMNRLGARQERRAYVLRRLEVALDRHRLAGAPGVERAGVVGCGDRDGIDPEALARSEDPDGDLAAVRYEELADRHAASRFSRNARRPSWPSSPVRSRAARCAASGAAGASRTRRFASRTATGPTRQEVGDDPLDGAVEVAGDLMDEPDPKCGRRVEALTGQEVTTRCSGARSSAGRTARSRRARSRASPPRTRRPRPRRRPRCRRRRRRRCRRRAR